MSEESGKALEPVAGLIRVVRGERVMLDEDLARHYGVETKVLNKAVTRNLDRFPEDFMFRLTPEEFDNLRNQFGTSSEHGGRRCAVVNALVLPDVLRHWLIVGHPSRSFSGFAYGNTPHRVDSMLPGHPSANSPRRLWTVKRADCAQVRTYSVRVAPSMRPL